MRTLYRHAPVRWLAAGLGAAAAGVALALFLSPEAGMALVLLGVGVLGFALGLGRSSTLDRELIAEVEQHMAELREAELRAIGERWISEGVSPTEQAYQALRESRDGAAADAPSAQPGAFADRERELGRLIKHRCERVWEGIGDRRYVQQEHGQITGLDGRAVQAEVRGIVEEVAALHHADSDRAMMEARIGDVLMAVRSTVGELLQVMHRIPYIDPADWSLRSVLTQLERAQQAQSLYRKYSDYQHYVTGVTLAARLALGVNPVSLVGWTVGQQVAMRIGSRVVKAYAQTWVKELLESAVALVYIQAARTYDPERVYRSADWMALVEALRIQARIPGLDHNRKVLLDRILHAQIPDEFAKLTLLRALAQDADPEPGADSTARFAALSPRQRHAIADSLAGILCAMRGLNETAASAAIEALEDRLQRALGVDLVGSGSRIGVRVAEGFERLAEAACDWRRLDRAAAQQAIDATPFAVRARKAAGAADCGAALERALGAVYDEDERAVGERRLVEPPRDLVGDPLAEPFVASLIDLLATAGPDDWPVEIDHMALLHASVLLPERKAVERAWRGYLDAASARLRERLAHADRSSWPKAAAPAILRQIGALGHAPPSPDRGIAPPSAAVRPLAVFEPIAADGRARWLLLCADRVVVGDTPDEPLAIDDGAPEVFPTAAVRFTRRTGTVADELVIHCGAHPDDRRLAVAGDVMGTFATKFGPVLAPLGLDVEALAEED